MGEPDPAEPSDAEVIRASLSDPASFAALFDRHAGSVHRYLAKRVGRADAEDLVGETFAAAFRSRATFDPERADVRPWLFGIATHVVHHHRRGEGRRVRREGAALPPVQPSDPAEDASSRAFFAASAEPVARALRALDQPRISTSCSSWPAPG